MHGVAPPLDTILAMLVVDPPASRSQLVDRLVDALIRHSVKPFVRDLRYDYWSELGPEGILELQSIIAFVI